MDELLLAVLQDPGGRAAAAALYGGYVDVVELILGPWFVDGELLGPAGRAAPAALARVVRIRDSEVLPGVVPHNQSTLPSSWTSPTFFILIGWRDQTSPVSGSGILPRTTSACFSSSSKSIPFASA